MMGFSFREIRTTVAMDQLTFKPNLTPAFQRKFQVHIIRLASYAIRRLAKSISSAAHLWTAPYTAWACSSR